MKYLAVYEFASLQIVGPYMVFFPLVSPSTLDYSSAKTTDILSNIYFIFC